MRLKLQLHIKYPDLSMLFHCLFVIIDLFSGNTTSLDEQVFQCLQACELQAAAAPPPRLCALETFGGRVAVSLPSISTAPPTQLFMNMDGRLGFLASLTCHKAI